MPSRAGEGVVEVKALGNLVWLCCVAIALGAPVSITIVAGVSLVLLWIS